MNRLYENEKYVELIYSIHFLWIKLAIPVDFSLSVNIVYLNVVCERYLISFPKFV